MVDEVNPVSFCSMPGFHLLVKMQFLLTEPDDRVRRRIKVLDSRVTSLASQLFAEGYVISPARTRAFRVLDALRR
jgi:hypothetical protein